MAGLLSRERIIAQPGFLWGVLYLNVSAGIGVIGMASPMIQEVFGGRLIGLEGLSLRDLNPDQRAQLATIGAAFAALLSVFNIGGRIGNVALFVVLFCVILTMYGGGFATSPPISPTSSAPSSWARSTGAC